MNFKLPSRTKTTSSTPTKTITIPTTPQKEKIEKAPKEEKKDNIQFWKDELSRIMQETIEKSKKSFYQNKGDDFIKDTRNILQNIAQQAKSECIHQINTRIATYKDKEIPDNIKREIKYYTKIENKWRRLEQQCIRGWKKRSVQHLVNGNLLQNLMNTPKNNRFKYTSQTSGKIYDVMILQKDPSPEKGKTIYQLEAIEQDGKKIKPIVFAKTIDHAKEKESDIFQISNSIRHLESIDEISDIINTFLKTV